MDAGFALTPPIICLVNLKSQDCMYLFFQSCVDSPFV